MVNQAVIIQTLQASLPNLLAIYTFGSRIQGTAQMDSDLGLAGDLADVAGYPVDLLDLRAASTVMQYQVITIGQRWWALDVQAALFEASILSEKTELDTARAGLLSNILKRGKVYG